MSELNELTRTRLALSTKEVVSQVVLLETEKGRGVAHVIPGYKGQGKNRSIEAEKKLNQKKI